VRKIREARRQASHEADLAEQKLKQIADVRQRTPQSSQATADSNTSPPPGNNGVDAGLLARYRAALGDAIQRNWIRPDSVPLGQPCKLQIRQLPGGEVIDVQVLEPCPYDDLGKRSLEAAVLKAQPLPYAGFESVFSRTLDLKFQPEER
jgi:colicin import membrane protein